MRSLGQQIGKVSMYQHILISTDGSEIAQKGVDHGLGLAKAIGAKTTIVTVTEVLMPYLPRGGEVTAFAHYQEFAEIQKDAAERLLSDVKEKAAEKGVEADTVCIELSSPAEAIVETAKERGCGLIVMASHGRRGLQRLMLGSVAREVLALSPIPVLVIP
jgi:nucleotide-binding universal stress UspA family protein